MEDELSLQGIIGIGEDRRNLSEVSQSVDRCAAPAFLKSSRGHIGVEPERN